MTIQISPPFRLGGQILEVGGGDTPLFRPNIDMRKLPTVDIVCDLEEKWPVPDSSYDGVFGKFVIEHVSWRKVPHFVSECFRVLKPGGAAMFIGPNTLEQCQEVVRRNKIGIEESALLYGGQEEKGWNEHKAAFSPDYAVEVFKSAGFERVDIKPWPGAITDMIIEAHKGGGVSQDIRQAAWYQELDKSLNNGTLKNNPSKVKLNIGSFTVMFKGWVNCDVLDLAACAQQNGYEFRQFDATKGIPYDSGAVDLIIASHFIEHINRKQGEAFLAECLRVLSPGGVLRLTVPDTQLLARCYLAGTIREKFSSNEGVKAAEDEAEGFLHLLIGGHQTVYDVPSLKAKMEKAGFVEVEQMPTGKSKSAEIETETKDMYPELSFYLEGIKRQGETISVSIPAAEKAATANRLKVGLISTQFFEVPPKGYSGLERIVWDLACGLAGLGHEVTIFAPEGSEPPPGGHLVITGPSLSSVNVDWQKAEEDAYKVYEPYLKGLDIIHGNNWFGFEFAAKSNNMALKCCHTHHGHLDPNWWLKTKPQFKLNFIALSRFMQREYTQMDMPSEYAWNGIDLEKYKYKEQKGDRLLFVGRLDSFKQPHVAIEIARRLNMGLDIFGGSFVQDPSYLEQIKRTCDGSQIVLYLDAPQEKKVQYMQNAMCLLFPSQMLEPWGLVAAEAMSCGTPVVATDDGAISEIVEDGVTGYVCHSIEEMCAAVGKVKAISPQVCRQRVERLFSREKMAKRYEELYRKIMRGDEW